jgi:hypothetical protein
LEELVLEDMCATTEEQEQIQVDSLVVESFVEKFNNKYDQTLLEEQKTLLNLYISSFVDNSLELKMYLNEEISRLKKELNESKLKEEICSDEQMIEKTDLILEKLNTLKDGFADHDMLFTILKVQQLVGEINDDAGSN